MISTLWVPDYLWEDSLFFTSAKIVHDSKAVYLRVIVMLQNGSLSLACTHAHNLPVSHSSSLTFPPSDLFSSICLQQSENKGPWHYCVIYVILFAASGPCVSVPCSSSADTVTQGRVTHAQKQADMHIHTQTHTLGTPEQMEGQND